VNKYSNYYIGDGEEYSMEFIFNFFAHLMKSISRPHIQCDKLAGFVDNQIVSQVQGCQNIFINAFCVFSFLPTVLSRCRIHDTR